MMHGPINIRIYIYASNISKLVVGVWAASCPDLFESEAKIRGGGP